MISLTSTTDRCRLVSEPWKAPSENSCHLPACCILDAGCGTDASYTRKFSGEALAAWPGSCQELPERPAHGSWQSFAASVHRQMLFSMVYSRSVFEHLIEPRQSGMDEIHRALKPGGVCVILTPNRYDYSSVVAQLTPQAFHGWFVNRIYGSNTYETFPTFYRANTPRYFKSLTQKRRGWKIRKLVGLRHYPANLIFSRILFRFGVLYDWLIAKLGWSALQPSLLIVLEKKL